MSDILQEAQQKAEAAWKYRRGLGAGLVAAIGLGLIALLAPAELKVGLWKLTLVAAAVYGGYWADRILFPYARPHTLIGNEAFGAGMLRRALLIAAITLAVALAL